MTQTYPLTITRNRAWYGKVRALQLYALTPQGKVQLGKVGSGKSVTAEVPRDATHIYGQMDWAKSETFDLTFVNPGEAVYANLWFTLNPFRNFGIPSMPCRFETLPR